MIKFVNYPRLVLTTGNRLLFYRIIMNNKQSLYVKIDLTVTKESTTYEERTVYKASYILEYKLVKIH